MAYTRDLKSLGLTAMRVRVSPGALDKQEKDMFQEPRCCGHHFSGPEMGCVDCHAAALDMVKSLQQGIYNANSLDDARALLQRMKKS